MMLLVGQIPLVIRNGLTSGSGGDLQSEGITKILFYKDFIQRFNLKTV